MKSEEYLEQGFRQHPEWLLPLLLVVLAQAGLTLQMFESWSMLRDSRPIVAGRHPLHLYHGGLGSHTFHQRFATACYDPFYQAGYPKTPVFDGGSRPAEFALTLAGGGYNPAAYKMGLYVLCLLVPVGFAVAGRGAGISARACVVAACLSVGLWWSAPVRLRLDEGDVDLLLAGLAAVVFLTWLSRYNWDPGPLAWIVLSITAVVGWYAHPVVWLGVAPIFGIYYLIVAPRHGLAWHLGLVGVTLVGLGPNFWWLWDWGKFWWLRQPSVDDIAPLPTWGALLGSWKSNMELLGPAPFGWPMVLLASAGIVKMMKQGQHSVPGTLVITGSFAFLVARLGEVWSPMINGGTQRIAPGIAAIAIPPVAYILAEGLPAREKRLTSVCVATGLLIFPLLLGWGGSYFHSLQERLDLNTQPIRMGLTVDQEELVRGLKFHTDTTARILIEEQQMHVDGWNWTALLAELTDRSFLGGLDPDACVEHAFCGMRSDRLNGRKLELLSNADLEEFSRRYNVGWILCRTPQTEERWRKMPGCQVVQRFRDGGECVLLKLARTPTFILKGSAIWEHADRKKVVLSNVDPVDFPNPENRIAYAKVVILSLHHQPGLRVSPNSVMLDRDPDPYDPIPMIRLRMAGHVSRIVLSWDNP